ncbi:alpha/beta hydrolase-fold protein [Corynebacterium aquilae]|uniref:Acyl-CoA:diacylglycerol acyltransferase n=1 Tax=Corynebacterium aquilae DSM 44791 TaxID=1431546 RepID=A0A1L7CIJ0_9CORY|nr:alpha/beta hydrolase-fold protein [Corynebacterium aquilae]APT85625.1 hypothetical protein CAQU_11895 [Corynebacterium aquilae DSM 44791]
MRKAQKNTRRNRLIALGAIPTALALGLGALTLPADAQSSLFGGSSNISDYLQDDNVPERTPVRTDFPKIEGLPEGVSVERQEWLDSHRVALFIRSAAMPEKPIQVQILLARDWYSHPDRKFPEVWALDGLRANEEENGWTLHTNIQQQYAGRNVNVILPVGGEASFYTDWERPDNGKHYMWESFLTNELPAVLNNGYRSNGKRAIVGLSMGGTAAINLAEHRPDLFEFVGSFSGYLDTTSIGMPMGIAGALKDGGGYDADAMWGPAGSKRWIDNDPKLGISALKGKTVYVAAGNGTDDYGKPGSVATGPSNMAGIGLEVMARMTTQTFVDRAKRDGVDVIQKFRPTGVHNWPYWQFELEQAWPYIADSLGLDKNDRGADCTPTGLIAEVTKGGQYGTCINNEYDIAGGKAEDFTAGRAFWSAETGAHVLIGRIAARYSEIGGPESWLGFPITNELKTPDGVGRFVHFQHGSIYWTPETGAHAIPKDMVDAWATEGYETGILGYPISEPKGEDGTLIQQFQGGYIVRNDKGDDDKRKGAFIVKGEIAKRYTAINTVVSKLGAPTSNEITIPGGVLQNYDNGTFYWSAASGAHFIFNGDIRDEWGKRGWEQGELGWPTSDEKSIPAGGLTIDFQHGTIKQINGVVIVDKK